MARLRLAMAAACAALTAACGGGDGPTMPTIQSLRAADPAETRTAVGRAADNLPNFGSLTLWIYVRLKRMQGHGTEKQGRGQPRVA